VRRFKNKKMLEIESLYIIIFSSFISLIFGVFGIYIDNYKRKTLISFKTVDDGIKFIKRKSATFQTTYQDCMWSSGNNNHSMHTQLRQCRECVQDNECKVIYKFSKCLQCNKSQILKLNDNHNSHYFKKSNYYT